MPTLEELARLRQQARQRRQPGAATGQNAAGVAQLGNAQRPGQPVNPVAGNGPAENPKPGNYGAVTPPATGGRQTKPGAPEGPPDFTPGAGPGRPAAPDSLDELTRMRMAHEKERKAAEERLAAEKGRALQQADARAGFAGLGLSGGTAALSSDIGRVQDREATLTLGELGKDQRTEEWQAVQRQVALDRIEKELGRDLNGDGLVAGKDADKANTSAGETSAGATSGIQNDDVDKMSGEDVDALPVFDWSKMSSAEQNGYELIGWAEDSGGVLHGVYRRKSDGTIMRDKGAA